MNKLLSDTKNIDRNIDKILRYAAVNGVSNTDIYTTKLNVKHSPTYYHLWRLFSVGEMIEIDIKDFIDNVIKINEYVNDPSFTIETFAPKIHQLWGDRNLSKVEVNCYKNIIVMANGRSPSDNHRANLHIFLLSLN